MQIKNRKKLIIICLLNLLLFKLNVNAEEFNISAKEIFIDKINEFFGKTIVKSIEMV